MLSNETLVLWGLLTGAIAILLSHRIVFYLYNGASWRECAKRQIAVKCSKTANDSDVDARDITLDFPVDQSNFTPVVARFIHKILLFSIFLIVTSFVKNPPLHVIGISLFFLVIIVIYMGIWNYSYGNYFVVSKGDVYISEFSLSNNSLAVFGVERIYSAEIVRSCRNYTKIIFTLDDGAVYKLRCVSGVVDLINELHHYNNCIKYMLFNSMWQSSSFGHTHKLEAERIIGKEIIERACSDG